MSISNANPSVATFNRYRYVATGGETSISGADANGNVMSYSPGREQVYLNGTMLVRAQDYTATTGTSITGLSALTVNDVLEVLAFTSFAVAAGVAQDEAPVSPAEGQLWLDTNGTVPGVQITRWSKTMAAGVTSLSGNDDYALPLSYTAGYETVYQNGALLSRGNDYTATNGTSITLTTATLANDIIEVFGPTAIGFADTYTQSQATSLFVPKSLTTTTGDIIYASAANTPARLAIGSTGQVLTVSGGIPAWAAASSQTLISSGTIGSGGLTLSSINQSYQDLLLQVYGVTWSTSSYYGIYFNNSANNGRNSYTLWGGGDTSTATAASGTYIRFLTNSWSTNANNSLFVRILNYTDTSAYKVIQFTGFMTDGTTEFGMNGGGGWKTNSAIDRIDVVNAPGGANFTAGSYRLWGIK